MKKIIGIALTIIGIVYLPFAFDTKNEKGSLGISHFISFVGSGAKDLGSDLLPSRFTKKEPLAIQSKIQIPEKQFSGLPENTKNTIIYLERNAFTKPPKNYRGGSTFHNYEEFLPKQTDGYYTEWDVKPVPKNGSRGKERIVRGADGELYYTDTHYGEAGEPAFFRIVR